jgi:hypothetical protein
MGWNEAVIVGLFITPKKTSSEMVNGRQGRWTERSMGGREHEGD